MVPLRTSTPGVPARGSACTPLSSAGPPPTHLPAPPPPAFHAGVGFRERNEASDFNAALYEFLQAGRRRGGGGGGV